MGNPNEEKQGKALIDAAVKNGVKHFVYSSVDRGGETKSDVDPTNVPHFISKHNIEQHLIRASQASAMGYTILRPVAFLEDLTPDFFGKLFTTSWQNVLRNEQKLQLVATSDIGFFAAQAFTKPEEYNGKRLTLVGDELTYDEFGAIFKQYTGRALPTTYGIIATFINWMVKDLGMMFKWFRDVGYGGDIAQVRTLNPDLKNFKTWLKEESPFKAA